MTMCEVTDNYRALFLHPTPMIDLRAPAEFERGAFPAALSLPLMTDDERAQVGICYKNNGQKAAIELGHQLVCGVTKAERMAGWLEFIRCHEAAHLYCWRGGLRSQTVQQWLADEGVQCPRVAGGYKAMRQFLLMSLEQSVEQTQLVLIGGKTGTGKTRVIERLRRSIDLEGLANHRGSSFGQLPTPQPSQIDYDNAISIALLRLLNVHSGPIYVEDEGRLVGRVAVPDALRHRMKQSAMVVVEESLARRVDVVIEDYIIDLGRRYTLLYGEDGARLHAHKMQEDLARIRKRLGGERHQQVSAMMQAAFEQQWRSGTEVDAHRGWIECLLHKYYDPMYEYQLQQRSGNTLFRGDRAAVLEWVKEHSDSAAPN